MIAVLQQAAEKAAAFGDDHKWIELKINEDGIALFGRLESDLAGYTSTALIDWDRLALQPGILGWGIDQMAERLGEKAAKSPVFRVEPATEKPPVRLIEREEWPIVGMAVATIVVCIPLMGGLL